MVSFASELDADRAVKMFNGCAESVVSSDVTPVNAAVLIGQLRV